MIFWQPFTATCGSMLAVSNFVTFPADRSRFSTKGPLSRNSWLTCEDFVSELASIALASGFCQFWLAILILAQLPAFDNWTLNWPLLVLLLLFISAAIYGSFSLRNEAKTVRETTIRRLRKDRFESATSEDRLQQFDQTIGEIAAERGGDFRPLAEDPLVQAISVPFGGVGGAIILEQLFRSVR